MSNKTNPHELGRRGGAAADAKSRQNAQGGLLDTIQDTAADAWNTVTDTVTDSKFLVGAGVGAVGTLAALLLIRKMNKATKRTIPLL